MASNFSITTRTKGKRVEFRLRGDFDGMSACELLNALRDRSGFKGKVIIDTNGLKRIYPFGRETFCKNLHLVKNLPIRLEFAGEHAKRIAPERNLFF